MEENVLLMESERLFKEEGIYGFVLLIKDNVLFKVNFFFVKINKVLINIIIIRKIYIDGLILLIENRILVW